MKRFAIYIALLFASLTVIGQERVIVTGRIMDRSTNKPLGFASVTLQRSTTSIVTNREGYFSFKVEQSGGRDTLYFSHLGYQTVAIPIDQFREESTDNIERNARATRGERENRVWLMPSPLLLDPVKVTPMDASSIVKMALSRVNKNYSQNQVQMSAFYRETIKKRNNYVSLNEAILDITKNSYSNYRRDFISIYKGRGNWDQSRVDTIMVKLQGGPVSAMDLDIVKDPFLGVDSREIDQVYLFKMGHPTTINDRLFYVVEFDQKGDVKEAYFRGKLYIDPETFAIGRGEFAMNIEERDDATKYFIRRKPASLRIKILGANYIVNYKQIGSLWFYDHSITELKFNTRWDRRWFKSSYTLTSELAVTGISGEIKKPSPEARIRQRDIISNRVSDFTDEHFWGDYNVIEPEASIERIISRIIKQLQRRE